MKLRTVALLVRLTPEEKKTIEENALSQGKPTAVFLRNIGLGARPKFSHDDAKEMRLQLSRIGSNLNQLAKACNTALLTSNASGVDLSSLDEAICEVRKAMKGINGEQA